MKETQKKVLGCFGLGLVVATTVVAATMPSQEASAVSTGVTDTLVVRVVGAVPDINISGITNGATLTDPIQTINVTYENIENGYIMLEKTNEAGTLIYKRITLRDFNPDYSASPDGGVDIAINLNDLPDFGDEDGYGYYKITGRGVGLNAEDTDYISFSFWPAVINVTPENTLNAEIDSTNPDIDRVVVDIYNEGGTGSPIKSQTITGVTGTVPISTDGLPGGTYTVTITAYNGNDVIYKRYTIIYKTIVIPDTGAPDTGGLFQNLNVSKEDYLITGLIVFFVLGAVAIGIVARNRSKTSMKKRK